MITLEIGKPIPFGHLTRLLWQSEVMRIGHTSWIYIIYEKDDELLNWRTGERGTARYTAYMYYDEFLGTWIKDTEHPRYNGNDGTYAGLPKSLRKLYYRHEVEIQNILHPQPAPEPPSRYKLLDD